MSYSQLCHAYDLQILKYHIRHLIWILMTESANPLMVLISWLRAGASFWILAYLCVLWVTFYSGLRGNMLTGTLSPDMCQLTGLWYL